MSLVIELNWPLNLLVPQSAHTGNHFDRKEQELASIYGVRFKAFFVPLHHSQANLRWWVNPFCAEVKKPLMSPTPVLDGQIVRTHFHCRTFHFYKLYFGSHLEHVTIACL